MSYKVTDQRKQTMLKRIGEAAQLIDDQRFLPFFRSIQIKLEKAGKADEWGKMVELALTKEKPSRYFASLCRAVKDGSYKFVEKVQEVKAEFRLYVHDKLIKFGFGKYQKYWVRKAQEFINVNGEAGFAELMEYANRKGISQQYLATALKNCKPPRAYYKENVIGGANG